MSLARFASSAATTCACAENVPAVGLRMTKFNCEDSPAFSVARSQVARLACTTQVPSPAVAETIVMAGVTCTVTRALVAARSPWFARSMRQLKSAPTAAS